MAVDNSTSIVTSTESGTGWVLDVTNANLSSDLSLKDFLIEFDGVVQSNSNFDKLSRTSIQYTGSSIGSTVVTFYRDTPVTRIQEVTYGDRMTSDLWESEFNRVHRILAEEGTTPSDQNFADVNIGGNLSVTGESTFTGSTLDAPAITSQEDLAQSSDGTAVPTTAWVRNASAAIASVHQGRISNRNMPVPWYPTNQSSQSSTLYFSRYNGRYIALYNTTDNEWKLHEIPSGHVNLSTSGGTIKLPHDVFIYDNSGTLTLELEAWTDKTERSVTLTTVDGEVVKDSDNSKKYLGIVYLDGNKEINTDSGTLDFAAMDILNHRNRIPGLISCGLSAHQPFGSISGTQYDIDVRVRTVSEDFSSINLINPHPPLIIRGHLTIRNGTWGADPYVFAAMRIYSERVSAMVGSNRDEQVLIEDRQERISFNVTHNTTTSGVDTYSIGAILSHSDNPDFSAQKLSTWITAEVLW